MSKLLDLELSDLAVRIRKTCEQNGFEAPTWENLLSKIMLVVTELHECSEAENRENLEEELADVAIRLVDILESLWPGEWSRRYPTRPHPSGLWRRSIEQALWLVLNPLVHAVEFWRDDNQHEAKIAIEKALAQFFFLCGVDGFGVNLLDAMEKKNKRNSSRGFRHGRISGA